jgi:hypothetical protein
MAAKKPTTFEYGAWHNPFLSALPSSHTLPNHPPTMNDLSWSPRINRTVLLILFVASAFITAVFYFTLFPIFFHVKVGCKPDTFLSFAFNSFHSQNLIGCVHSIPTNEPSAIKRQ